MQPPKRLQATHGSATKHLAPELFSFHLNSVGAAVAREIIGQGNMHDSKWLGALTEGIVKRNETRGGGGRACASKCESRRCLQAAQTQHWGQSEGSLHPWAQERELKIDPRLEVD